MLIVYYYPNMIIYLWPIFYDLMFTAISIIWWRFYHILKYWIYKLIENLKKAVMDPMFFRSSNIHLIFMTCMNLFRYASFQKFIMTNSIYIYFHLFKLWNLYLLIRFMGKKSSLNQYKMKDATVFLQNSIFKLFYWKLVD